MSCNHIENELSLYIYGELSQEEEERVEHHLTGCGACAAQLTQLRTLGGQLSTAELPISDTFLNQCRVDLARSLRVQRAQSAANPQSWFARLRSLASMPVGFNIPVGAMALIAVGFLAGKFAPSTFGLPSTGQQAGFVSVRSVEPDASGKVRIAFDNVSQKTISGSPDDPEIRALLLSSMKAQDNAGVRVEAAGVIKDHAADPDVRNALLDAVQHDPNVGVRISAAEGLKLYGADPAVRKAMTAVLLNDGNSGVRMKAIDLLTAHTDPSMVGPLQNAIQKEDNSYVRMRMTNALRDMHASIGTF